MGNLNNLLGGGKTSAGHGSSLSINDLLVFDPANPTNLISASGFIGPLAILVSMGAVRENKGPAIHFSDSSWLL